MGKKIMFTQINVTKTLKKRGAAIQKEAEKNLKTGKITQSKIYEAGIEAWEKNMKGAE